MTDDQKHLPWNEGQSTKPDVDALMKAFPVESMTIGRRISDEEVRAAIGMCEGNRYRTVYSAWIKRLNSDHQINLYREKTLGFYVPTFEQVAARTHPALQHIGRTAKKQVKHLSISKPDNDQHRQLRDHQGRLLHTVQREAKKARMNLLPTFEVKEPVRAALPKN